MEEFYPRGNRFHGGTEITVTAQAIYMSGEVARFYFEIFKLFSQ